MAAILIIDDESVSRMILSAIVQPLSSNSHQVKAFARPKEALDWISRNDVSLVLTDHKMPEMTGIEFVRVLRDTPSCVDVPVILLSADNSLELRQEALCAGATDFIAKPVDPAVCRERCQTLLEDAQ